MMSKDLRFKLTFVANEEAAEMRLREFLHLKGISKRTLTATKYDGGLLLVNGIERDVRHVLKSGDEVTILFPLEQPSIGLHATEGPLTILYEDDALIIIDKPPGQSTIPSRDHPDGTVANFVAGKFARDCLPATVHVVTRLDRDTSGIICIAKNRHIHHLLSQQMIHDGFHKQYIAIVEGHVDRSNFMIDAPIGRKEGSIIERMVRDDGQLARTEINVVNRFTVEGQQLTKVALVLLTGRTHQIRVHMQWAGHPLAGDDLYGGKLSLIGRQALHCAAIEFSHPLTGERVRFESDVPLDMSSLIFSRII
ncbi:RluA family pseudouridine synthase [Filibacter tadaridae]|uniref:RluA family pseudouridine synthase n=1 Tax=Filibacter tadaridae TaxID=2483811 RepID=UPI0031F46D14